MGSMTDQGGASRPRRKDLAFLVSGVALLLLGVGIPAFRWWILGALIAPIGVAMVVFTMAGGRSSGNRSRPLLAAVVGLAVVVAGALVVAPRFALSRMDGPYLWQNPEVLLTSQEVDVRPLPQGLLVGDFTMLYGLAPETGEPMFKVPLREPSHPFRQGRVVAGLDGSFVVVYSPQYDFAEKRYVYYSPEGEQRWEIAGSFQSEALAIDNNVVVLSECASPEECVYTGYDSSGTPIWKTDPGPATPLVGANFTEPRVIRVLPRVLVTGASSAQSGPPQLTITVRGVDGRTIATEEGHTWDIVDDTVILRVDNCQLSAVQGGQVRWTTRDLPCASPAMSHFDNRSYFEPAEGGNTVTIDLDDGQWRRTDRPLHGLDVPDLAADEIWVKRDGRLLTGVDAATGQALWTFEAPDDEMTFTVRHGTVVVTHGSALNKRLTALADKDVETAFTLLDARTGRIPAG